MAPLVCVQTAFSLLVMLAFDILVFIVKKILKIVALPFLAAFTMPLAVFAQTSLSRVVLSVPFTSQAPAGNWAQPWQDYCEEASSVMAAHFVWGLPILPGIADQEMQIANQYEDMTFYHHRDTSVAETAQILRELYRLQDVSVKSVGSPDDIKEEIRKGKLVILPAAGRMLGNPHFKSPGPLYHMLVVTGFDNAKNIFITNDPGTRYGESLAYNQQKLFAAIHDWNNGDVLHGKKKMIVVGK